MFLVLRGGCDCDCGWGIGEVGEKLKKEKSSSFAFECETSVGLKQRSVARTQCDVACIRIHFVTADKLNGQGR